MTDRNITKVSKYISIGVDLYSAVSSNDLMA